MIRARDRTAKVLWTADVISFEENRFLTQKKGLGNKSRDKARNAGCNFPRNPQNRDLNSSISIIHCVHMKRHSNRMPRSDRTKRRFIYFFWLSEGSEYIKYMYDRLCQAGVRRSRVDVETKR